MADVFISYARSTGRIARAAADALAKDGFSVWFDEEIPAHRAYADVISEQLNEAKAVLVLWSKEAAASQWVRSEANRSRENGTLVQARLDDTPPPMPFDQIQCADLRQWRGNPAAPAWKRLSGNISELVRSGVPGGVVPPPARTGYVQRRDVVIGGVALAAAAIAGVYALGQSGGHRPPAEAEVLLQTATAIMQDGRPSEQKQAILYLTEATRIAPEFASGWGALALTYALRKFQVPPAARPGEDARCRSAAQRALDLDSKEPFALCSLVLLTPTYLHWAEVERRGRDLGQHIDVIPLVFHLLADVLVDVGRSADALKVYGKIDRKRFLIPLSERSIIQAMWNAGDIQAAEQRLDEAVARWPQHYAIWTLRAAFLTHSGRADEAVRVIQDPAIRPVDYPQDQLEAALATAKAAQGIISPAEAIHINLKSLDVGSADALTYLNRKITMAQVVAQRCVALGDVDTASALLDGYYFGEGRWARVAPAAGDMDRSTLTLFEPSMSRFWPDPRFAALTDRIGLDHYWRESRAQPDFKRG